MVELAVFTHSLDVMFRTNYVHHKGCEDLDIYGVHVHIKSIVFFLHGVNPDDILISHSLEPANRSGGEIQYINARKFY